MSKLTDFATLSEARVYRETTLKPIDERMINERGVFALIGIMAGETLMQAIEGSPDIPERVKSWFKPSEQGVDIADLGVIGILSGVTQAGHLSQSDSDKLTSYAYTVLKPFENTTQEEFNFNQQEDFALPGDVSQHIINFSISNSAPNLANVVVMHRYGSANDLTPWHQCGSTRVQYKQARYRVMVPAVDAEIRELKLVAECQLGLSD